jgi:adenylate kinase family enzyme
LGIERAGSVDNILEFSVDRVYAHQLAEPMNHLSNSSGRPARKTRVVEIIGPAGAGKTTLCQALDRCTESLRLENFPDVRRLADAPFFISNCLRLIPGLVRPYRLNSRQLTRREFAWMAILYGWPALLRNEWGHNNKIVILDQGPIYLLAEMRLFGPEYLRQEAAESLWQGLYSRWSATLHMVIWLDAANHVLLERIRNRRQEHVVKTQPATVVFEFLDRYRAEYESILSILTAKEACLKVLQFDTGWQQPQDIVNQCLYEMG